MGVHIIINDHIFLPGIIPVQASGILFHHALEGDRRCHDQRIEPWEIKALADQASGSDQRQCFLRGSFLHLFPDPFMLLL